MGYSGAFPSEDSCGDRVRKAGITKVGKRTPQAHGTGTADSCPESEKLRKRHQGIPAEIIEIAWKAQNRLHKRYRKLTMAGKDAVPTREYQLDQLSPLPDTAAADPVLVRKINRRTLTGH